MNDTISTIKMARVQPEDAPIAVTVTIELPYAKLKAWEKDSTLAARVADEFSYAIRNGRSLGPYKAFRAL